jgi:hypothetical protein
VISNDELTGVQALQRKHPGLPLRSGKVERREYEYIRHGTLSFMVNFEVATGDIGTVSAGPTRTEADYVQHIQRTVEADPRVNKWHFILDNLNIHQSESLVRYVAAESDIPNVDLGLKGQGGHPAINGPPGPPFSTRPTIGLSFTTRPFTPPG